MCIGTPGLHDGDQNPLLQYEPAYRDDHHGQNRRQLYETVKPTGKNTGHYPGRLWHPPDQQKPQAGSVANHGRQVRQKVPDYYGANARIRLARLYRRTDSGRCYYGQSDSQMP